MEYVKINNTLYPAVINGRMSDNEWDGRSSKSIKLEMTHNEAFTVFCDGAEWSILKDDVLVPKLDSVGMPVLDENGIPVMETIAEEYDNSEYSLAGDITDHRDGTVTVKMGKLTDLEEAYELMLGGI